MKAFVDRIEDGVAVLLFEGLKKQFTLPLAALPPGTREGDSVELTAAKLPSARPGAAKVRWRDD